MYFYKNSLFLFLVVIRKERKKNKPRIFFLLNNCNGSCYLLKVKKQNFWEEQDLNLQPLSGLRFTVKRLNRSSHLPNGENET